MSQRSGDHQQEFQHTYNGTPEGGEMSPNMYINMCVDINKWWLKNYHIRWKHCSPLDELNGFQVWYTQIYLPLETP